jgi:hypothetical protein
MESDPSLTLNTVVPYYIDYEGRNTSCPEDSSPSKATLQLALEWMMQKSDNRMVQALRVFLGQANVDLMAIQLGMTHTLYQHRDGCGSDAMAHPNRMTLTDAGLLYEGVSTGALLQSASRASFYSAMLGKGSPIWNDLVSIAQAEAPAGMPAARVQAFVDAMDVHYKAGSYGLTDGFNITLGGSVSVPFRVIGQVAPRDYAIGFFVSKASTQAKADAAWGAARAEVMREQIRDALRTW